MKTRFALKSLTIALVISFALFLSPVAAESDWFTYTLALDGVDDFASAPDNTSLDLGIGVDEDFQISLRFYVPDLTNNSMDTLVWKNGAYGLYIIFSSTSPDRLVFRVNTGITSYVSLSYEIDIPAGWHAFTARFDNEYSPDQDLIAVQLDGAPEITATGFDVTGMMDSTSPFYVGGYGTINPASGWIEELKITVNESDVRAWWHFDEDWGDTVFLDSSLYGNTLTGENGAQIGNPTGFPPLPGEFSKTSPSSGLYPKRPTTLTITWTASLDAFDGYEYCYDTINNYLCDTAWLATTDTQATLTELNTSTYYFWQVRAKNTAGTTEADSGSWWGFETVPLPPSAFSKNMPADGAVNQALNNLYVDWNNSIGADSYEYCYDTVDDDACPGGWTDIGLTSMVFLDNLSYSTTYYYQVRAVNWGGTTYADGGTWWSFTTLPEAPEAFGKSSPTSGAIDQPGIVPLSWEPSTRATGYEYCWNENYTENTTDCIHGWISVGANTTADFNVGIGYWPKTYYWQVRAVNPGGVAYANSGNWWSFTTLPPAPRELYKQSPTDGSTNQPKSLTLSWFDGILVDEYEYCYDTTPGTTCEGTWTSTGTDTSAVLSDLLPATTYYWQMRATNAGGTTYANGGAWWSFTTIAIPGSFDKVEPLNGATSIAKNVNFYWYTNSTNALTYEYCYDTSINSNCDTSWVTDNNLTNNYITGLDPSTTYNWQVRAGNSMGYTYANGGTWWSFTTGTSPASFGKSAPLDGVNNQSLDLVISWTASAGMDYYEYCYDTSDDDACGPWLTASWYNKALNGLDPYTTYFWQVRAVNSFGTVYADASSSDFWSFTTGGVPGAFDRTSPPNEAEDVSINPTLTWDPSTNVGWYDYCIDTSDDNDCTDWVNNYGNTSVQVEGLEPGTTYFWHVKAKNDFGTTYAGGSDIAFWSITTDPKPAAFNKTGPAESASNQPLILDLTWESSLGASYYEYCYGTTNPCSNWTDNGNATSRTLEDLSENTTYYWNVRAINDHGTTYSNGNDTAFWLFSTGALPEAFTKWMPEDGEYYSDIVRLVWQANSHQDDYGFSYEYCYDTIDNSECDTTWISTYTNSGELTDLIPATYYWQVRANNLIGRTYANDGTWWSFTVPPNPGDFSKTSPANGATNLQATISLSWTSSSDVFEYEYCYDAVENNECDASWLSADTDTSVEISSLSPNTTYYWQLRSSNASGTTYANDGVWWSFTTEPVPGAFSKISPVNKATNRPPNLKLSWGSSDFAEEYQYCLKLSGGTCAWTTTNTNTSVSISGLATGLYKWQVRAINAIGTTSANNGVWWSFTVPPKPGAFNKTSPLSGLINKPTTLTLYWQASTNAVSYQYCVKLKLSDTCTWKSTGLIRKVTLTGLLKNTRYFWQVRARNATGITTANNGTWWNFTTVK